MKKLLCLLLCLALPLCALAEDVAPLPDVDFTLMTIGDTVFYLGNDAALLLSALEALTGEPLAMSESESCMFDGMDREYENSHVVVGTYPVGKDGGDVSESVIVYTDALMTARGATVGMTTGDIEALYGEPGLRDPEALLYQGEESSNHQPYLIFGFDPDTDEITYWILGWGRFI